MVARVYPVGIATATANNSEANEYQMRRMSQYEVDRESESMTLGSGWLVPTDQPLGVLATYLLEPHSDESLASWGFFDPGSAGNEYRQNG